MDWQCTDCKRLEPIKTPTLIKEGEMVYLVCDCGAFFYIKCERSKDSTKPHTWGIPNP